MLAKAAGQSTFSSQEVRIREQARSHSGLFHSPVLCLPKKLVGASLLAKAAGQSTFSSQEVRFREQARSHSGLFHSPVLFSPKKLVGASLLAKAAGQSTFSSQEVRIREQARSHSGLFHSPVLFSPKKLAREGGRSIDIFVTGSPHSRASSLPQWPVSLTCFVFTEETCGSELAREGGRSVTFSSQEVRIREQVRSHRFFI
ncbi:hypothetical protein [Pseudomonas sp. SC3(2021)]|uniref:hypothetical protein n=1 Tax=Pseudomonas sp. SC3(2021) TaxID=2871493 RepID=UPI001C9E1A22|nr:hypothetical protein [Pseudomonas sp. SC3(2021)]